MSKSIILLLFISIFEQTYSQSMAVKYKIIKQKNLNEFLEKHHGRKVTNDYTSEFVNYYECDDNMLVIENKNTLQTWVEFDRLKFYEEKKRVLKWHKFEPFLKKQSDIMALPNSTSQLLNEFFDSLKMKREYPLSNIDLNKVNKAIKSYSIEKAIENLYTSIIIFEGEYVKEKRGGAWAIVKEKSISTKDYYKPVLIDKEGKNYDFDLNITLLKTFYEKRKIDIKQQIEFALLRDIFQVESPPRSVP